MISRKDPKVSALVAAVQAVHAVGVAKPPTAGPVIHQGADASAERSHDPAYAGF